MREIVHIQVNEEDEGGKYAQCIHLEARKGDVDHRRMTQDV